MLSVLDSALATVTCYSSAHTVAGLSYLPWPEPEVEVLGVALAAGPWHSDTISSQVSAVLSTPLWEWVLQRFGKRPSALGICVSATGREAGAMGVGNWQGGSHGAAALGLGLTVNQWSVGVW